MFKLSAKEFSQKYYGDDKHKARSNRYFSLDCQSGEGLINPLLPELKKISTREFEYYLNFILKKCININRSFSDAVEFLSIWLKKSPDSLLYQLKNAKLKQFFYRTEYDHEGDQWYFPKLLQLFSKLTKGNPDKANEILNCLFETFDFFNMPKIFVTEIIGYDRLEKCIIESPKVFKQALILKIYEFIELNKKNAVEIDIGLESRKFLNKEFKPYLVSWVTNSLFTYPNKKFYDRTHQYVVCNSSPPICQFYRK
ncbi:MAG: hypothetical protein RJA83_1041 [Pseudomonadota bacterium]|jgi:hypothetical protein